MNKNEESYKKIQIRASEKERKAGEERTKEREGSNVKKTVIRLSTEEVKLQNGGKG